MKKDIGTFLVVTVFIAFMLVTAGAAVFPELLRITAPVTCPGGEFKIVSQGFSTRPGESGVTRTMFCVDQSERETDISFFSIGVGFVMYNVIVFVVLAAGYDVRQFFRGAPATVTTTTPGELTEARIRGIQYADGSVNGNQELELSLEVLPRGHAPYKVTITAHVPPSQMDRMQLGRTIHVKVDPENQYRVTL